MARHRIEVTPMMHKYSLDELFFKSTKENKKEKQSAQKNILSKHPQRNEIYFH